MKVIEIEPIQTDAQLEAAILLAQELWGAPIDSMEGKLLDQLATYIDEYERKSIDVSLKEVEKVKVEDKIPFGIKRSI